MTKTTTIAEHRSRPLAYAAATIASLLVLVAALRAMERIGWCAQGFALWTSEAAGACTSQNLADPYTFTHFEHGLLFYWFATFFTRWWTPRGRYLAAALLEVGWEILENTPWVIDRYRQQTAALGYIGDSILNSGGDLLACCLGYYIASRLPPRWTIALLIGVELVLLATIRDNLTLNVVMLLFPLPALQEWQLGK